MNYISLYRAEMMKTKRLSINWITVIGISLVPLLFTFAYLHQWEHWARFMQNGFTNPWTQLFHQNFSAVAGMLFPMYIILMISLFIHTENTASSWKMLFVMPVKRSALYCIKLVHLITYCIGAMVLFNLLVLGSGYLTGILQPKLMLLAYTPDFSVWCIRSLKSLVSIMGIFGIHYALGLRIKNYIIPIAAGIFLLIISVVIANGTPKAVYIPYAYPLLAHYESAGMVQIPHCFGFALTEILSVVCFFVALIIGYIDFSRKQIM